MARDPRTKGEETNIREVVDRQGKKHELRDEPGGPMGEFVVYKDGVCQIGFKDWSDAQRDMRYRQKEFTA